MNAPNHSANRPAIKQREDKKTVPIIPEKDRKVLDLLALMFAKTLMLNNEKSDRI